MYFGISSVSVAVQYEFYDAVHYDDQYFMMSIMNFPIDAESKKRELPCCRRLSIITSQPPFDTHTLNSTRSETPQYILRNCDSSYLLGLMLVYYLNHIMSMVKFSIELALPNNPY